jgi:DNA helicase-2/ATP-dependent DNA helicase PcrA
MLETEHTYKPPTEFVPSEYQSRIFDFVKNGAGNAIVQAVAGSGKTTTICKALKYANGRSIFLAFNSKIAKELQDRGVDAKTFHSFTYKAVQTALKVKTADKDKLFNICKEWLNSDTNFVYGSFIRKLVGLGKQSGIGCLVPDTRDAWLEIIQHQGLELTHESANIPMAIELTQELLKLSNEKASFDFDDMLYLPVLLNLSLPKYDFVFVDEAQDTNAIGRELIKKVMGPNSRLIAVGDSAQAIYGFRGADSDSLDLVAKEFNCVRLPLTISYRCAKSIVRHAQSYVSHIEASDHAPEGTVDFLGEWNVDTFLPDDYVVCRTTKPLVRLGNRLMRAKKPFTILGRDIGNGLTSLIKKLKAKDLSELEKKLDTWHYNEISKARDAGDEAKQEAIEDRFQSIMSLVDDSETVQGLLETIDAMFSDKQKGVTLCTIHKSKGLEAKRVFWLNSSQCPAKWAKQDWQQQQELNLCYVATTRAMTNLTMIEMER